MALVTEYAIQISIHQPRKGTTIHGKSKRPFTYPVKEIERRLKGVIIRLPVIAGNEVVNFALDNFKRQAWPGDAIQPWRLGKIPNNYFVPVSFSNETSSNTNKMSLSLPPGNKRDT